MRPYEVMVIFDAATEPPAIQAVVDRVLESVRASEGTPGHIDRWGRRPFAYEVKHRREGYYVLVEFAGDSRTVADLDRMLALTDEVLRHKVIRQPDKVSVRAAATARRARDGRGADTFDAGRGRRPTAARGPAAGARHETARATAPAEAVPDGDAPPAS